MPRIDISATALRRRVSNGETVRYQVAPAVAAYISHHGLYARA
jgi:nicotinic acid mononucleotide adenylyltransferase